MQCTNERRTDYLKILSDQFDRPMKVKDLLSPSPVVPQWKKEVYALIRLAAREGYYSSSYCHMIKEDARDRNWNMFMYSSEARQLRSVLIEQLYSMDPEEYL